MLLILKNYIHYCEFQKLNLLIKFKQTNKFMARWMNVLIDDDDDDNDDQ